MKKPLLSALPLSLLALCALTLPVRATWTYIPQAGKYNGNDDKEYTGAITDSSNWTIYVLQLGDGTWQIGAGTFGVTWTYGSALAGDSSSKAPIPYDGVHYTGPGSGVLDLSTLTTDLPDMEFTAIGPRFLYVHDQVTDIIMPSTIKTVGQAAFAKLAKLAELDLSRTQIESIPDWTDDNVNAQRFGLCQNSTALEQVFLPETLTYVGKYAFGWLLKQKAVIHFLGDVPAFHAEGAIAGSNQGQYALCVNALKYPNWRSAYAEWKYDVDADMKGQNWPSPQYSNENTGWIPESVRFSVNPDWPAPFGAVSSLSRGVIANNRVYLIQEGVAGAQTPASSSVVATEIGRTNVTFEVTAYLGTSSSAELAFTFNGQTTNETVTVDGTTYTFAFPSGLDLETKYAYNSAMTAASGNGSTPGTITTVGPDVKLANPAFRQPDDGLSATVSVDVSTLLEGNTADLVFTVNGDERETRTVSATGTQTFDLGDLALGTTYDCVFTATSSVHGDVATTNVAFTALGRHWVYTPNESGREEKVNNCKYSGTISDRNWTIRVYHDTATDKWIIGTSGNGSTTTPDNGTYAVLAGSGDLEMSTLSSDTGLDFTAVGGWAFNNNTAITSLRLPETVKAISPVAFYRCSKIGDADLSNTAITNIRYQAFQNNTSLTNIVLPSTLQSVGFNAFAWGPDKRVIHFFGDVPTVEPNPSGDDRKIAQDWSYINGGADQAFYAGNANKQYAFCVDAVKYPQWKTDSSTTPYDASNPFPSNDEATWMHASVRPGQPVLYGINAGTGKVYKAPFGNSSLGRSYDTSSSGRCYLIHESHADPTTLIRFR